MVVAWRERALVTLAAAALMLCASGCVAGYAGPAYYDPQRCQWQWVSDGYGGYNELSCWHRQYNTFQPYYYGGSYVRSYPGAYVGPRMYNGPVPRGIVAPPVPMARPVGPPNTVYVP